VERSLTSIKNSSLSMIWRGRGWTVFLLGMCRFWVRKRVIKNSLL
jgi:hypothetical protein